MGKVQSIETSDFGEVKLGDSISIYFEKKGLVMSGLHVKGRPGKLHVSLGKEYRGGPERFLNLKDVTEDCVLESITRTVERESYKRGVKEIDFTRYASKRGSRADLEEALGAVQNVVDHFDYRVSIGDPLFDQWMVDAYDSARKAVKELEELMTALGHRSEKESKQQVKQ